MASPCVATSVWSFRRFVVVRFRFGRFAIALASVSDLDQAMFYYRSAAPTGRLSPPFGFRLSYQTDSHSLILVVGFRSIFNVLLRVPRMVLGFGVFDPGVFRFVRFPSCTVVCWWRGAFNPIAAFRVTFLRKFHAVVFLGVEALPFSFGVYTALRRRFILRHPRSIFI